MAAVYDNPPTTFGCTPALLLNNGPKSAVAAVAGGADNIPVSNVMVHPLVLLSVLDHHTRRQEGAGRVIGTLLGKRDGDRVSFLFVVFFRVHLFICKFVCINLCLLALYSIF